METQNDKRDENGPCRQGQELTFSSTVELDVDLLVHVLGQVEDVLLARLLLLLLGCTATARTATLLMGGVGATAACPAVEAASAAASGTPSDSFGHGLARCVSGGVLENVCCSDRA